MNNLRNIRRAIIEIGGKGSIDVIVAEVTEVTGDSCSVRVGDLEVTGVALRSVIDSSNNAFRLTPAVGSMVLVADHFRDLTQMTVIALSEVDKIEVGTAQHTIAKADVVKTELEKLSARVDGIIDAIKNGVPGSQDGGAALHTSIKAALATITDKEDFSQIENTKIKHG